MEKAYTPKRTNWMGINDPNALAVLQLLQPGDIVEFRRQLTIDEGIEIGKKKYASHPLLPLLEGIQIFVNSMQLSGQKLEFVVSLLISTWRGGI